MVRPLILMVDDDPSSAKIRRYVLEISGYDVVQTESPEEAHSELAQRPDALVCNLRGSEPANGFEALRKRAAGIPVVGLLDTPFGSRPARLADRFAVKIDGPRTLLKQLDDLLRYQHHTHPELEADRVVFVDATRRYVDASQKACDLIGYRRGELLGKRIDDISAADSKEVQEKFESYVKDGAQDGVFVLKHKDGHPVPVFYKALVLPDGCLAAKWEPAGDSRIS
jgi:PAS domain S-box-containing protein